MPELNEIKGVGPVLAKACTDNGYGSVEKVAAAMLHELVAVPGISEAKAKLVIAAAQTLLSETPSCNAEATIADATPAETAPAEETPTEAAPGALQAKEQKPKKKKDKKKEKKKNKKKKKKKAQKKEKKKDKKS